MENIDPIKLQFGDKVRYVRTQPFWFSDMVLNAKYFLTEGKDYTVSSKKVFSSWTKITLRETGEVEYNLAWFNKI